MSGNKARHKHTIPLQTNWSSQCRIVVHRVGSSRATCFLPFADLVVIAKEFYPIPFRTRPSKPSASMVLRLKPRESRTLPGLPRAENKRNPPTQFKKTPVTKVTGVFVFARCCPGFAALWPTAALSIRCRYGPFARPPHVLIRCADRSSLNTIQKSPAREISRGFVFPADARASGLTPGASVPWR